MFLMYDISEFEYSDWCILKNDKNEMVGSILIYITLQEKGKKEPIESDLDALEGDSTV